MLTVTATLKMYIDTHAHKLAHTNTRAALLDAHQRKIIIGNSTILFNFAPFHTHTHTHTGCLPRCASSRGTVPIGDSLRPKYISLFQPAGQFSVLRFQKRAPSSENFSFQAPLQYQHETPRHSKTHIHLERVVWCLSWEKSGVE